MVSKVVGERQVIKLDVCGNVEFKLLRGGGVMVSQLEKYSTDIVILSKSQQRKLMRFITDK